MTSQTTYVRACALADVPEDGVLGVALGDVPVAIIRDGGEVFALRDVCSHEEVPLSEGEVYDATWSAGCTGPASTCAPARPPGRPPPCPCPHTP